MSEPAQAPAATPQAPAPEPKSPFAPSWDRDIGRMEVDAKPLSFEKKFEQNADRIAKELQIDTRLAAQEEAKSDKRQAAQDTSAVDVDDLGDAEVEYAPGKKLKRSELAKRLTDFERLSTKQKQFERESYARMQQAAEQKKQAEAQHASAQRALQIQQRLEQVLSSGDPDMVLRELGFDPDKVAEAKIQRQYEDLQKTPEQREVESLKRELERRKHQELEWQKQQQEAAKEQQRVEQEKVTNQYAVRLQDAFMKTADHYKLPKTALTIQRMANVMQGAHERNLDPTFEQIGKAVAEQYKQDTYAFLSNLNEDEAFQSFPKEVQEKIRRSMLSKLGHAPSTEPDLQLGSRGQSIPSRKPQKSVNVTQYNDYLNKLRGGR